VRLRKRTITTARYMKRFGVFALISLAAGAAAATAAGVHSAAPSAAHCGGKLWRLKTLTDPQKAQIAWGTAPTTIKEIRARRGPGKPPTRRTTSFQLHNWEVPAQITSFKLDATGSVRLVLYDDGAYMNAVIPSPSCLSRATRGRAEIEAAWHLFVEKCGRPAATWTSFGGILFVRGIGFWSARRPIRGAAPNGAELHPVTGLRIVAGC
jgi:hypothetical protein